MTPSKSGCKDVQDKGLAFVSGDTTALEKQRLAVHLETCASCRAAVSEMTDLFETARAERFLPSAIERDRTWESLQNRIEAEASRPTDDAILPMRSRLVPRPVAILIGAVAASAIFALGYWMNRPAPARTNTVAAPSPPTQSEAASPTTALPELAAVNAAEGLFLGTLPDTAYQIENRDTRCILTLSRGTVWIRFKKSASIKNLEVAAPGVTVQVTGTVLTVSAEPNRPTAVGVLSGHVRVFPQKEAPIFLAEGEAVTVGDPEKKPLDTAHRAQAAKWLASSPSSTDEPEEDVASASSTAPESAPQNEAARHPTKEVSDLYLTAESKMAEGDFKGAAKILERIVALAPASSRADTARLDLARLYTRNLNRPGRAEKHLKAYLSRHPKAPNAPMLKKQLSEISKTTNP